MIFTLDKYKLSFDNIKYETFKNSSYYGIIFNINNDRYELIHNYILGNRLLINTSRVNKDIPFKKETFGFLPDCIKCEENE